MMRFHRENTFDEQSESNAVISIELATNVSATRRGFRPMSRASSWVTGRYVQGELDAA
jgi:hypothetical protein